jgi:hypothetical protein
VTHVPARDPAAAVEEPVAAFKDLCADAGDALALADPEGNEFCAFAPGR